MDLHDIALCVTGGCASVATLLALIHIFLHFRHWVAPVWQRKDLVVIFMVPVYAVTSFGCLYYPDYAIYIELFRDAYESFTIYAFFCLMVNFLENTGNPLVDPNQPDVSKEDAVMQKKLFPFCCFKPFVVNKAFITSTRRGTLQYAIIKPLCAATGIVTERLDTYYEGHYYTDKSYMYITATENIAVLIAMFWLFHFYLAFRDTIHHFKPTAKFLCIKGVIFLTFWQSVCIAGLSKAGFITGTGEYTTEEVNSGLKDGLICVEMLFAAFFHFSSYPVKEADLYIPNPSLSKKSKKLKTMPISGQQKGKKVKDGKKKKKNKKEKDSKQDRRRNNSVVDNETPAASFDEEGNESELAEDDDVDRHARKVVEENEDDEEIQDEEEQEQMNPRGKRRSIPEGSEGENDEEEARPASRMSNRKSAKLDIRIDTFKDTKDDEESQQQEDEDDKGKKKLKRSKSMTPKGGGKKGKGKVRRAKTLKKQSSSGLKKQKKPQEEEAEDEEQEDSDVEAPKAEPKQKVDPKSRFTAAVRKAAPAPPPSHPGWDVVKTNMSSWYRSATDSIMSLFKPAEPPSPPPPATQRTRR
eukprot:GILJ01009397.1.p1 GENE.GILJ01009397.1~~GILJ01009397.1.p1  ORF type:complete len:581 (-),score=120.83 GILJ01009397.1:277-2019(-)